MLKEVRAQVLGEVERQGLGRSHIQILAGLTRLRQAACDPRLLGLPREFGDDDSGKLVALRELVQTSIAGGHRVLVFSQFVSMLTIVRRAMDEDGVAYEYLDGSTRDRQACVENFRATTGRPSSSSRSRRAGAVSISQQPTPSFTSTRGGIQPSRTRRRIARTGSGRPRSSPRTASSRRGRSRRRSLELAEKKRELVGAVLSEDVGGAKKLTKNDLEDLFRADLTVSVRLTP